MVLRSWLLVATFAILSSNASPIEKRGSSAYNYRDTKAWGVNLGNWLILERWIDPSLFEKNAPNANDEWDFSKQVSNPSKVLKEHWDSWITEDDFKKLASVKANHVRIPIGFWAFIKPDSGEPYVSSGQKEQIERILGYCNKYGLYAIIDLHALPGSQNGEDHSGHRGSIDFYSSYNIKRGLKTVQAIVDWMNGLDSTLKSRIASIESANEPKTSDKQFEVLKDYYSKAYKIISDSDYKVPMMFHDSFKGLGAWKDFLPASANAIIDLHPYYAFPPNKDKDSIIKGICDTKSSASSFHLPVFFGEWSLASGVANENDSWMKQMMDTQASVYKTGGVGGTFWTIKNKINNNAWSFEMLVDQGIVDDNTFSKHGNSKC